MAVRAAAREALSDAERWELALSIARGAPTARARDRQRRVRWSFLLWVSGLVVVLFVAGAVIGLLAGDDGGAGGGEGRRLLPEPWPLVALVVGASLEVTGFVLVVRSGQWGARWRSATSVLTRAQQRSVVRQVRGRAGVVPEQLPVLIDHAQRLVLMDRLVLVSAGLVVIQIGSAGEQPLTLLVLLLCSVTALVLGIVALFVERARALRFLAQHAPPAAW